MSLPRHVGVYGGGRMGAGIAHAFLVGGSRVTIVESGDDRARQAHAAVASALANARERGTLSEEVDDVLDRLCVATDGAALADAELVIEAVPEVSQLKVDVLATAATVVPDAILATNTSSLSINDIARQLPDPTRLLGLHFFNPVPASELVEIVVGRQTDISLVAFATQWVTDLGKTSITVTDSPGFASSRLGVALALEAIRMVEEGVATVGDIDTAMTLGYRHPTGPLKTTDIVGLDVRLAIAEHLASELGSRFEPPQLLRQKVAAGELGRKAGKGFFEW
jgi:3-hydroxybutyryl-CoA dehydrogenase